MDTVGAAADSEGYDADDFDDVDNEDGVVSDGIMITIMTTFLDAKGMAIVMMKSSVTTMMMLNVI